MLTLQDTPTLGQLLKEKRGDGYRTEAALAIGVSRQVYGQWEDDYTIPGFEWVGPLTVYLGLSHEDLIRVLYRTWLEKSGGGLLNAHNLGYGWVARPIDAWVPADAA